MSAGLDNASGPKTIHTESEVVPSAPLRSVHLLQLLNSPAGKGQTRRVIIDHTIAPPPPPFPLFKTEAQGKENAGSEAKRTVPPTRTWRPSRLVTAALFQHHVVVL
eukprot:CAMPEP_0177781794 /NCGR_PEP_ID=MMETSP0491_2-20121128/18071_1 /TAXON_ID=63592 /ORGANISM="Tetraselmis chuii, Strain PLY429" /LENGTH=105 /DNA_ID=CAMNT_0019301945 /DNA_START=330 /DNA_END=647 /DNA_ORIENTATION=+